MEVLGRRRAVRDADVLLRAELEEALEPRARVLGAVPLVAVRQEQRQPRRLLPLRAARDDELVDHDLRAVDEVAELRLPEDERVRGRDRVAVLEAERRVLRERGVVDLERGVRPGQVLDRGDGLAGERIVEHEVTVREGAPLGVLPREADRDPVLEQRRERQRLRLAPVDTALGDRLAPPLELALELRMDGEPGRHREELLVERPQPLVGDGGLDDVARPGRRPGLARRRGRCRDRRPEPVVGGAERADDLLEDRVRLLPRHDALLDEPRGVLLADRRLQLDPLDLQGLRVGRLVLLLVAEAPVADEVDDEVVAELGAVGERETDGAEGCVGVVRVDVDDRDVEALREVARVPRRPTLGRIGRETDLVVRDEVERAAGGVPLEALQVERLRDDALAGEGGVAVDEDRDRDRRVVQRGAARAVGLLGARPALDDGVDRLEVARVRRDRDVDLPAPVSRVPEAGRWYFTSPLPPSGSTTSAS